MIFKQPALFAQSQTDFMSKINGQNPNCFDELAALLAANGIQPSDEDSNDEYVARIEAWNRNRGSFSISEVNVIKKNGELIRAKIERLIKIRTGMMAIGQGGKWVYTLIARIKKIGSWGQLVKSTSAFSPKQLAIRTFGKTLVSRSLWIVTAGITAIEIGFEFKSWYNGQITGKQFWINVAKKIVVNGVSVVGGACGAAMGAAIGMCIGPIGGLVGAIIGGIIGSVSSAYATEKILESFDKNYKEYTSTKLLTQALNFYELPHNFSLELLEKARMAKIALYHPDKWSSEPEQRQKTMAERYSKTNTLYEILKGAVEVQKKRQLERLQ